MEPARFYGKVRPKRATIRLPPGEVSEDEYLESDDENHVPRPYERNSNDCDHTAEEEESNESQNESDAAETDFEKSDNEESNLEESDVEESNVEESNVEESDVENEFDNDTAPELPNTCSRLQGIIQDRGRVRVRGGTVPIRRGRVRVRGGTIPIRGGGVRVRGPIHVRNQVYGRGRVRMRGGNHIQHQDQNNSTVSTAALGPTYTWRPPLANYVWPTKVYDITPLNITGIQSDLDYFNYFLDYDLKSSIVEQSNLYAIQINPNKPLGLSLSEFEQFLGIVMMTSIIKLPCTRDYWSSSTMISQISSVMTLNRFEQIKSSLHFNDNTHQIFDRENNDYDRLYKIRPLLNSILEKCKKLSKPEMLSIDEQIIPFKGKSSLRQYLPKKPKKWGYKLFVMSDVKGLVYNFELYTGKIKLVPGFPDIGSSGNIVLHLCTILPKNKNHKVYFDNWFNSLLLVSELAKLGIWSLGTIRMNRLKGCNLMSDKDMKKLERGIYEEQWIDIDNIHLTTVKWFDNRPVCLLSSFVGANPCGKVCRYDKKNKLNIEVECPRCIHEYNKFMGGVDTTDALIAAHRTILRSKRWYLRIFFHMLDLVCVNAFALYKRDCEVMKVPKNKICTLKKMKWSIAEKLCFSGKVIDKKRGRPSTNSPDGGNTVKKRRGPKVALPSHEVRFDELGHWPVYAEKKGKCKVFLCKGTPLVKCFKCNVYLCFTTKSNCFLEFHTC